MTKKIKFYLLFLMYLVFTKNTVSAQEDYIYPDKEWEYIKIESPCNYLNRLNGFVIDSLNTTGLIIVKNGKVVLDYGDTKELSYSASVRKSILSMMYGKYVEDGTIKLDATLEDLKIDDITQLSKEEKQATVDQIINARSGVYVPASNPGSGPNQPERYTHKPGTYFYYNNWDYNVAGTIFEQETDKNIYQAFEEDFAIPLDFQDFDLSKQRKGGDSKLSMHLAYYFYLSTRDMARLGYLMLRKGKWKNMQIIPSEWINKTTTKVSNAESDILTGYSYMWWLYDSAAHPSLKGAYTAVGMYGQYITIIPELDMVVAHKTKSHYRRKTSLSEYNKLINKIVEGEEQSKKQNFDFEPYIGTYTDDNFDERSTIEVFIENEQLILKDSFTFTEGVTLNLCNELMAIITATPIGDLPIYFTRDENEKINGFHIQNSFIKKN